MIKNVIFDVNKVLRILKTQNVTNFFTKNILNEYGKDYENISTREYFNKFFHNKIFEKYDLGLITQDELIVALSKEFNEPIEVLSCILEKRCLKKHNKIFTPMINFIKTLKTNGFKVFILSNMGKEAADVLKIYLGEENFDDIIFSCEVHMSKPYPEMYKYALERFKINAEESLFVDDTSINLTPFENLGGKTYLFDYKHMKKAINEITTLIKNN